MENEEVDIAISALKKMGIECLVKAPSDRNKKLESLRAMLENLLDREMFEECSMVKEAIDQIEKLIDA